VHDCPCECECARACACARMGACEYAYAWYV